MIFLIFTAFLFAGMNIGTPDIADVIFIIMFLLALVTNGIYKIESGSRELKYLIIILFITGIGSTIAENFYFGSIEWLYVFGYFSKILVMLGVVAVLTSKRRLSYAYYGWLLSAVASSIIMLLNALGIIDLAIIGVYNYEIRQQGLMGDPNIIGAFLVPVFLWSVHEMVYKNEYGINRGILILCTALVAIGVILTFSRGAWINLVVSLFIYVSITVVTRKSMSTLLSIVLIVCIASGAAFYALSELGFLGWIIDRLDSDSARTGYYLRKDASDDVLDLFKSSWVGYFGAGPGMSVKLFALPPHNIFLQTLIELGLVCSIFMGYFITMLMIRISKSAFSTKRRNNFVFDPLLMLSIFIGFIVNSLLIDTLYWRLTWILVGLLLVTLKLNKVEYIKNRELKKLYRGA